MAGVKGKSGRKARHVEQSAAKAVASVKAPSGRPAKPPGFPKEATKYWNAIIKLLEMQEPCQLSKVDGLAIGTFSEVLWRKQSLTNNFTGEEIIADVQLSRQLKGLDDDIKYWCGRFYLDPTSRSKSKVESDGETKKESAFDLLGSVSGYGVVG